jgi:hypothetical protein
LEYLVKSTKLWNSLCNLHHFPIISSQQPKILLSILFPNTLNFCSSLRVTEHEFIWLTYSFTGIQDSELYLSHNVVFCHNIQFSRWLEYSGGTWRLHLHLPWIRRQQVPLKWW